MKTFKISFLFCIATSRKEDLIMYSSENPYNLKQLKCNPLPAYVHDACLQVHNIYVSFFSLLFNVLNKIYF